MKLNKASENFQLIKFIMEIVFAVIVYSSRVFINIY